MSAGFYFVCLFCFVFSHFGTKEQQTTTTVLKYWIWSLSRNRRSVSLWVAVETNSINHFVVCVCVSGVLSSWTDHLNGIGREYKKKRERKRVQNKKKEPHAPIQVNMNKTHKRDIHQHQNRMKSAHHNDTDTYSNWMVIWLNQILDANST